MEIIQKILVEKKRGEEGGVKSADLHRDRHAPATDHVHVLGKILQIRATLGPLRRRWRNLPICSALYLGEIKRRDLTLRESLEWQS